MDWAELEKKQYDKDRYCCEHFAVDAYKLLTGKDVSQALLKNGLFHPSNLRNFKPLKTPKDFCFVLFRAHKTAHVGIMLNNRVLHLSDFGMVCQPLSYVAMGYSKVIFYELN